MRRYWLIGLLLAGLLAACEPGDAGDGTPAGATVDPTAGQASEAPATGEPEGEVPTVAGRPPQTTAAAIQPPERRDELTRLSTWLDFKVVGLQESAVGTVTDYVVNTCETYVIYMLVEPDGALDVPSENQLVIPFEAVTINSGYLDAEAKAIGLHLAPSQVQAAPAFPEPLPLLPATWEAGVRSYWQEVVRVGKLNSECGANAVQKIAYANQLLGAELKDGNQNLLGTVTEAVIEPESGKLGFYVVELADNQGLTLVPIGKTNIPAAALEPGSTIELVLLAENQQLLNAPRIESLEQATSAGAQNSARQHWGQ
jgi:hypothetical protein